MIFIFIIPQNFNFKNKFLGIIDYSTLILLIICYAISFSILNLLFSNINIKIILFIIFNGPLTIISIIGFNHENIIYVLCYLFKFFKNRTIYLYRKNFLIHKPFIIQFCNFLSFFVIVFKIF